MAPFKQLFNLEETLAGVRNIAVQIDRSLSSDPGDIAIVGIHKIGVPLAQMLCEELLKMGRNVEFGKLDITMYRDDIGSRSLLPMIYETEIPFDISGKYIILVDDVLSSGRTIRAALDALTDYGRPALIRLAVLVDRGEPEFPIRADFAGFNVSLPAERKVVVRFENDDEFSAGISEVDWNRNL